MLQYEIMSWNSETNTYKTIGWAKGETSTAARDRYVKDNKWKPISSSERLFAKPPICR